MVAQKTVLFFFISAFFALFGTTNKPIKLFVPHIFPPRIGSFIGCKKGYKKVTKFRICVIFGAFISPVFLQTTLFNNEGLGDRGIKNVKGGNIERIISSYKNVGI